MADRLLIFVSSSMSELPDERGAVQRAVEGLGFDPFLYERDAHASIVPAKEQWESVLAESDLCLVILYRKLGAYTQDEIDFARASKTPILAYRKNDAENVLEAEHGDYIQELEDVESGIAVRYFTDTEQLQRNVQEDLQNLLKKVFQRLRRFESGELGGPRRRGQPTTDGVKLDESARPPVVRRDRQSVRRVDAPRGIFVGRSDDITAVHESIDAGERLVAITGPPGVGRKTLLRNLAHGSMELDAQYPDGFGVSPVDGRTAVDLEDMLQSLWDLFYATEDGSAVASVVDARKRRLELERVTALVIIEDGRLGEDDFVEISAQIRQSTVLVSTGPGDEGWNGEEVALAGLHDHADRRTLFEATARLPMGYVSEAALDALLDRVGGNPSLIEHLARRAKKELGRRAEPSAMAEWIATLAVASHEQFEERLVAEEARAAFDAGMAAGTIIPLDVIRQLPGGTDSVVEGVKAGSQVASSPRFRVSSSLAAVATSPQDADVIMAQLFDASLDWADGASAQEVFENREFVLRMLDWGGERGRNADVIRLASSTEHAMAVGGRHGAWRRVLGCALDASRRQPTDPHAEGWALHQLGSVALLRDEVDVARELLHEALERREEIGDDAGIDLSRHNLGLVPMAVMSLTSLVVLVIGLCGWFLAMSFPGGWWEVPGDGEGPPGSHPSPAAPNGADQPAPPSDGVAGPDGPSMAIVSAGSSLAFPSNQATIQVGVLNNGDTDLRISGISIVQQPASGIDPLVCEDTDLAPGIEVACNFVVAVDGAPGRAVTLTVVVMASADSASSVVQAQTDVVVIYPEPVAVGVMAVPAEVASGGQVVFDVTVSTGAQVEILDVRADGGDSVTITDEACPAGEATSSVPYRCSLTSIVNGVPGDSLVVQVIVTIRDRDGTSTRMGATSLSVLPSGTPSVAVAGGWTLSQDADGDTFIDAGDVLLFDFSVTNAGDVRLSSVGLSDELTGASAPRSVLTPGERLDFVGRYKVTRSDVDAGFVVNDIRVRARGAGESVTSRYTVTVPIAVAAVETEVTSRIAFGEIRFHYTVNNTGNTPLANVRLTDRSGLVCEAPELPEGTPLICDSASDPTGMELERRVARNDVTLTADPLRGPRIVASPQTLMVPFSVLEVGVAVVTAPGGEGYPVYFAGRERTVGLDPVRVAVPGTAAEPWTSVVILDLADDWTLTGVGCVEGEIDGPTVLTLSFRMTGEAVSCRLVMAGKGIIEITPDVVEFPSTEFSLTNVGTAEVLIPSISPEPTTFAVVSDGCGGVRLPPEQSCRVTISHGTGLGVIDLGFADDGVEGDGRILLVGR